MSIKIVFRGPSIEYYILFRNLEDGPNKFHVALITASKLSFPSLIQQLAWLPHPFLCGVQAGGSRTGTAGPVV